MALVKRGKTWHCDFVSDGVRYRQSTGKTDWREAQQKERELYAEAEKGALAANAKRRGIARLAFKDAAEQFTRDREPNIAANSAKAERERARAINRALGARKVASLTPDDVLAYMRDRKAEGIANATINRELDVIRGVLKKAKRWHRFADEVKPLKTTENIGRALLHEEKVKLVKIAGTRPTWESAYFAAMLALNTTCRGCELKGIRWRDVNLLNQAVVIQQSKTAAGQRVIPLNRDAMQIIMAMRRRAEKLGETLPDHYVFFACENGNLDPSKPQKSWRTAWRNLTKKAGLPGLRFHDLRHHAITELAESQTSDAVIMGIAGHVSKKMLEHYSHARLRAKRTALDALSGAGAGSQGYDTNNGTKQESDATVPSEVIENMVELVGIEPTTSSLRTMRSPS
jgi:integrase